MAKETLNTREQPPTIHDQIMGTIEETLKDFDGADKKEFLISKLNNIYGVELTSKIINSLPEEFFKIEKIEERESLIPEIESSTAEILSEIENLPEEKREEKVFEVLEKEYKISAEKIKEYKTTRNIKIFLKGTTLAAVIIATLLIRNDEKSKENNKNQNKKELSYEKENSINFNERFDVDTYNSLSREGKEVYRYIAENDPTKGKNYQILDKENALVYVFDSNNKLLSKFEAGFGKDEGDEKNTSVEYKKGKNTTPAGVYVFSNFALPSDIKEYGELQFSLYGVSTLGDKIFIGEHQTYSGHGELKGRTEKLETPTPEDNKFSDGCINVTPENFKKFIKPYFKGNYDELLFVLPDKKSKDSGVTFDVSNLTEGITPIMLEMTTKEEKVYEGYIAQTKDIINASVGDIATLKNEYNILVKEFTKDKNVDKQTRIENIKKEINQKKETISKGRIALSEVEKKVKELNIKRQNIEKIVMGENK